MENPVHTDTENTDTENTDTENTDINSVNTENTLKTDINTDKTDINSVNTPEHTNTLSTNVIIPNTLVFFKYTRQKTPKAGLLEKEENGNIKIFNDKKLYLKKDININKFKTFEEGDDVDISLTKKNISMNGKYMIRTLYNDHFDASRIIDGIAKANFIKIYYNTITNITKNKKGGKRRTKKQTKKHKKKSSKKTKRHR